MSAFEKQIDGNHYKNFAIQPTEYCQKNRLNFCEAAVVKYVSRHHLKGGRKDIEKAIHFLEMLMEMEYPVANKKEVVKKEKINPIPGTLAALKRNHEVL